MIILKKPGVLYTRDIYLNNTNILKASMVMKTILAYLALL